MLDLRSEECQRGIEQGIAVTNGNSRNLRDSNPVLKMNVFNLFNFQVTLSDCTLSASVQSENTAAILEGL